MSRCFGRGPRIEERKQAVHKDLPTAVIMLVAAHFLPFSACVVLLWLNIGGYYIGGQLQGGGLDEASDTKLSTLQFVAKGHELLMQASLSVMVIGFIRHDLLEGRSIPFGAIFGSLQFTNASYVLSKEFAGVWKANFKSRWVMAKLVGLLLLGSLLAITVGPSSAITMRPRLDSWEAGGTDIVLDTTREKLWPDEMTAGAIPKSCSIIDMNTTCISRGWEDTGRQLISYFPTMMDTKDTTPESYRLSDRQSIRDVSIRTTAVGVYGWKQAYTTTSMSTIANAVSSNGQLWAIAAANFNGCTKRFRRFMWRKDAKYTIKSVKQPSTVVLCNSYGQLTLERIEFARKLNQNMMAFPTGEALCDEKPVKEKTNTLLTDWHELEQQQMGLVQRFMEKSSTRPELQFVSLPNSTFGQVSIGALASIPPGWQGDDKRLYSCAIRSRWLDVDIQGTRNNLKLVRGDVDDWPWAEQKMCGKNIPVIKIDPKWAHFVNPTVRSTNKSVYHSLVEAAGKPSKNLTSWSRGPLYLGSVTESILSSIVTAGLSLTEANAQVQGEPKIEEGVCANNRDSWYLDMLPNDKKEFGYGGNIYDLSSIDVSLTSKFTMQVDVEGYAYSSRGPSMILSCMVLLTYCTMVLIHVVFVFWKRSSSTSWDSVSEIVTLAMQSQPSDKLENTCAGINSTGVFSQNVRIVKTGPQSSHLELDFDDSIPSVKTDVRITDKEFFG